MSLYLLLHNLAITLGAAGIILMLTKTNQGVTMAQNKINELAIQLERVNLEILAEIESLKAANPELDFTAIDAALAKLDALAPELKDDEVDPDFGVDHPE